MKLLRFRFSVRLPRSSVRKLLYFFAREFNVLRFSGLVLASVVGLTAVGVAEAQTLTTLTSFNGSNGDGPQAGLTLSGNTLYGTTELGRRE